MKAILLNNIDRFQLFLKNFHLLLKGAKIAETYTLFNWWENSQQMKNNHRTDKKVQVNFLLVIYGKMGKNIIFQYPVPEESLDQKNSTGEYFYDLEMSSLATMLCPSKQQLVNKPLRLNIDNISFIARPTSLPISEKYDLTHFSFVFVFPKPINDERSACFLNILKVYCKVLLREQIRCNFLTNEIYSLIELRDKYKMDWNTILSTAFKQSELAKEIKSITDSIIYGDSIQIRVNGWIEMCIKYPYDNVSYNYKSSVKPYDACVILKDSPKLNYPVDGLDIVEQIRSLLSPNKSLQEISKKENLSLNTVCSIVQHMIEWGVVKTVPKLTMKSILHINPNVEFPLDEKHILEFKTNFNLLPSLIEMLGYFNKSSTIGELFENKKEEWRQQFFKAIIWLLRNNYVYQCETFIQLGKLLNH